MSRSYVGPDHPFHDKIRLLKSSCLSMQAKLHEILGEAECKEWDDSLQVLMDRKQPDDYFPMIQFLQEWTRCQDWGQAKLKKCEWLIATRKADELLKQADALQPQTEEQQWELRKLRKMRSCFVPSTTYNVAEFMAGMHRWLHVAAH